MAEPIGPFSDPRARRKLDQTSRLASKAFNLAAEKLLKELVRMYPGDPIVKFLHESLAKYMADGVRYYVPAANFFREVRNTTVLPDGRAIPYVDLLAYHDEQAFAEPIPVTVLRGAGMSEKWKIMGQVQRDALWVYVDRLVELSAKAVFSNKQQREHMDELSDAVIGAVASVAPGKQLDITSIVRDKAVQERAKTLISGAH